MIIDKLENDIKGVDQGSKLYPVFKKVQQGIRITEDDAIMMFKSNNILDIATIANYVNNNINQNRVYYIMNGHINYSNICAIHCSFCSFSKKRNQDNAYEFNLEEIKNKFLEFNQKEIREVHIVGGLHPDKPFSYYTDMLSAIREINQNVTIKAFTAVEIDHFSKMFQMSVNDVLLKLKDSGLGALPGGGAEIFAEHIRKKICPTKITGKEWLEVHKIAHQTGLKSNATMLFGHIESFEDRVDHLSRLRSLQDETGGFLTLIPLTYHPDNNPLIAQRTSGLDELKTIAISRIFLDNFKHIKAYWIMLGIKIAQLALSFGADDLDGTVMEEKIVHAAGAKSPEMLSKMDLINLILETNRIPVERDSFYNEIIS